MNPFTQTTSANSRAYNQKLTAADLTRSEAFDPSEFRLLSYSKPHDLCDGVELHVGNMAGGFPFQCLGTEWKSVEFLYLCGRWSDSSARHFAIQQDLLTAKSGYAAKRYKKRKYIHEMRPDFDPFKHQWMFWCIWQKCLGSSDFRKHLLFLPDDAVLIENVPHDPVWAACDNGTGTLCGCNAVPKILTLCRRALQEGTQPDIDLDLLNRSSIYILGEQVVF